jgi:hypothetical protein
LPTRAVRRVGDQVVIAADEARRFLVSPAGARFRRIVAGGVILTAPLILRNPVVRRHPLLRWVEALGGAALVIKAAEALRDWEASGEPAGPIVIDVPPAD